MPIDPTIKALASAIGEAETGPSSAAAYTKKGASGEYGRYQFMPETYKNYAQKYLGDAKAAPTVENQNKIVYDFISDKKKAGYNPAQIASMWNAGEGKPDAYKENFKGVNSQGVVYDTPGYVAKVSQYYQKNKTATIGGTDVPAPQLGQGQQGSFLGDVGHTLTQAGTGVSNSVSDTLTGKINPLSGLLQGVGAVAGGIGGLTNNVLEHAPVVGGVYKGVEGLIGQGVGALAQTNAGQGLIGNYQNFAQAHPEIAGDINAGVNIASAVPLLKGVGVAKNVIENGVSTALKGSAEKVAAEALGSAPKLSEVKNGIKQGLITTGKKGPVIAPDAAKQLSQKYLAEEIKAGSIPKTAGPSQIATGAESAAVKESKNLEKLLSSSEIQNIAQPEDLAGLFKRTVERAGTSATSGENPAQTLLKVFADNLPKHRDILPIDILKARRAVGTFIRENRGDWSTRGVLTGFKSARNAFWDESRDLLAKLAPDVPVLPSLEKQAALYRVSDYIAPKVKQELTNTTKSTFLGRHPIVRGLVKTGAKAAIEGTGIGAVMHMLQ